MSRIFISYKRVDKDKVFKIKEQIESALGERCWIDLDGIESDKQFVNVIISAIDQAEVVLFMYSHQHTLIKDFDNDWTIRELDYANEEKKRIVFINVDNSPLKGWFKFMYGKKQQVDGTSDNALKKLCNDLNKWLFPDIEDKYAKSSSKSKRTTDKKETQRSKKTPKNRDDIGMLFVDTNEESLLDNDILNSGMDLSEIEDLLTEVSETSYIQNLRIGRSWILPQMVEMAFNETGEFDEKKYFKEVQLLDYEKCWTILLRNFHAISLLFKKNKKACQERLNWWNKPVAIAMAKYDLQLFKEYLNRVKIRYDCFGGDYVYLRKLKGRKDGWYDQMFFTEPPCEDWTHDAKTTTDLIAEFEIRIRRIEEAKSISDLCEAIQVYDNNRCIMSFDTKKISIPTPFVNSYAGDGAYSAMMTMVKYLKLTYNDQNGKKMKRDECIDDITSKPEEFLYNGLTMFRYASSKLLDEKQGGSFRYKDYKKI